MALSISEVTFPLTIPNISKLERVQSSEILICGVPWQVEFFKEGGWLKILYRCAKKDNSSQWSYAVQTSVKLLSFHPDQSAMEKLYEPHIFCNMEPTLICHCTTWSSFDVTNNYVKYDAIKLEVNIKVADPNNPNKSIIVFEPLDKCCGGSSVAEFRLTVTNIDTLTAVQTPVFMMRNIPWILIVHKSRSNDLCVGLSTTSEHICCSVRTSFKLISTKLSKQEIQLNYSFRRTLRYIRKLSSWEDLLKPQNGYVNNDSVVIEVNIRMEKLERIKRRAANSLEADANLIRLECAICLENINKDNASSTVCGHIFCTDCIKGFIETRKLCPSCNTKLELNQFHRVFLPM